MIGQLNPQFKKATIIGGGFSGLLMAYRLHKKGLEVTLIEKEDRVGGLIQTEQTPYGIAEKAAHSLLATGPVLTLAQDLGVDLCALQPNSKARYILRDGKMKRFPLRLPELLQCFWNASTYKSKGESSETLAQWAEAHLGKAACEYLISPFVTGIFACTPSEILVHTAFPKMTVPQGKTLIHQLLTLKRSKSKKGRPRMMAPRFGMQSLTSALEKYLRANLRENFITGSNISLLDIKPENTILCTPASVTANLLQTADPKLSKALKEIPYSPLITATVFYKSNSFKKPPCGVGVLVPQKENRKILGILFNSSSFQERVSSNEFSSFTVMLGGTQNPFLLELSDDQLKSTITNELSSILCIKNSPAEIVLTRWPQAIPIYGPKLKHAWDCAKKGWCSKHGQILFGNYTGQVSLRGMIELTEQI